MENYFKSTNDWIQKTHENMRNEAEYKKKRANNENVSSFNVKLSRPTGMLVPIHSIRKYDETMYNFIIETTQTIAKLNERILELENKN
jgi:hypothetical protein